MNLQINNMNLLIYFESGKSLTLNIPGVKLTFYQI